MAAIAAAGFFFGAAAWMKLAFLDGILQEQTVHGGALLELGGLSQAAQQRANQKKVTVTKLGHRDQIWELFLGVPFGICTYCAQAR